MVGSGNNDALLQVCFKCKAQKDPGELKQLFGRQFYCGPCYEDILKQVEKFKEDNDLCVPDEHFLDGRAWQGKLPWWAYDKRVGSLAQSLRSNGFCEPIPLQCAVGPAVLIALGLSFATWGLFVVVPFVVGQSILCVEKEQGSENSIFAYKFREVWSIVTPIFICFLMAEILCLRYSIVPMLQVTGGFKILSRRASFYVWLPFYLLVSFVSHADLVTNGIFMYAVMHMQSCTPWGDWINCIWNTTMEKSVFGHIPGFHRWNPAFRHLAVTFWCLMFLQGINGWFGALPLSKVRRWAYNCGCCTKKAFDCIAKIKGWASHLDDSFLPDYSMPSVLATEYVLIQGPGHGMRYLTIWDRSPGFSDHGCALLSLADSSRMCSITAMRDSYSQDKVKYYMEIGRPGPAYGIMKRILQSTRYRLIFCGILQSGIQLNLQVSMLSMTRLMETHVSHAHGGGFNLTGIDKQLMFSVVIGMLNFCYQGSVVLSTHQWIAKSLKHEIWSNSPYSRDAHTKQWWWHMQRGLARLRLALFIYFLIGAYTAAKLFGCFECEQSMFNLTGCATNLAGSCFSD